MTPSEKKWQFYIETAQEILGGIEYVRKNTGVFTGTENEAREELRTRMGRTFSPFVIHGFEPIDTEAKQ